MWFGVVCRWFGVVCGVLGWFGVFPRTPCKPPSHTPHVQLDPQLPVKSFKWGTWVFLSAFIGHHSFIQGIMQSGEDFHP